MYKVRYKYSNPSQSWTMSGSYGDERSALSAAARMSGRYFMVQVLGPEGHVIWTA